MKRALDIQTGGSMIVVGAFVASEVAARLLDTYPASSISWRLNVGLFQAFENARLSLPPLRHLFGPDSLSVAVLLLVLIAILHRLQSRFAAALFANLGFLCSLVLAYAATHGTTPCEPRLLPLSALAQRADLMLVAGLLIVSFIACAVSHYSFAIAIRKHLAGEDIVKPLVARERRLRFSRLINWIQASSDRPTETPSATI